MSYKELFTMDFGVKRRKEIIKVIKERKEQGWIGIPVNNRHQLNLKHDNDLNYLLKKEKVKLTRVKNSFFSFHSQTYITL